MITKFIRFPIERTAFSSAASQPDGEAIRIVIPTIAALGKGRAPKFSGPNNQSLLEQPALL
jgi:hypothetical protein